MQVRKKEKCQILDHSFVLLGNCEGQEDRTAHSGLKQKGKSRWDVHIVVWISVEEFGVSFGHSKDKDGIDSKRFCFPKINKWCVN